jgi:hypothetical protein
VEAGEEGVVIGNPVEDRVREDGVYRLVEHEVDEVRLDHLGPVAERVSRGRDHGRGRIDRDHPAVREPVEQHLRDTATAAAGVEHRLVPLEFQPVQDRTGPGDLRIRHAVVGGRVPIPRPDAGRHSAVVTGPVRSRPRS